MVSVPYHGPLPNLHYDDNCKAGFLLRTQGRGDGPQFGSRRTPKISGEVGWEGVRARVVGLRRHRPRRMGVPIVDGGFHFIQSGRKRGIL